MVNRKLSAITFLWLLLIGCSYREESELETLIMDVDKDENAAESSESKVAVVAETKAVADAEIKTAAAERKKAAAAIEKAAQAANMTAAELARQFLALDVDRATTTAPDSCRDAAGGAPRGGRGAADTDGFFICGATPCERERRLFFSKRSFMTMVSVHDGRHEPGRFDEDPRKFDAQEQAYKDGDGETTMIQIMLDIARSVCAQTQRCLYLDWCDERACNLNSIFATLHGTAASWTSAHCSDIQQCLINAVAKSEVVVRAEKLSGDFCGSEVDGAAEAGSLSSYLVPPADNMDAAQMIQHYTHHLVQAVGR